MRFDHSTKLSELFLSICLITYYNYFILLLFFYFIGDEAIISMSVAGEVTDTSIVEVGRSRPQFQYSRVNIALKLLEFLKIICRVLLLAIYKVNVNG